MDWLYIGAGGFVGANLRYWMATRVSAWFYRWTGWNLPLGTVFVNVTGSLLLTLFLMWSSRHVELSPRTRLMIATGFFGAYTTFSTYAFEGVTLMRWENVWTGLGYILLTNALCLLGVVAGLGLANRWWPAT